MIKRALLFAAVLAIGLVVVFFWWNRPLPRNAIVLPFPDDQIANQYIPMGETIEHADSPNGHPGIDFSWFDENFEQFPATVTASAAGTVQRKILEGEDWRILIDHGRFATGYGHVATPAPEIEEGVEVAQGQVLGIISSHLHWEFGTISLIGSRQYPNRLCPVNYLTAEALATMNTIPMMDVFADAGYTQVCDGDYAAPEFQ